MVYMNTAQKMMNRAGFRTGVGVMILTNLETVPGRSVVEHYGLVSGSTVQCRFFGTDLLASIKNLFGGELKGYTRLLEKARAEATHRMVQQASEAGANAVINVRYSTSSIAKQAAEIYVYGTAVKVG